MASNITPENARSIINSYSERLPDLLPRVFENLVDPNCTETFLYNYSGAIKQRFEADKRPDGQLKLDSYGEAALEAGIVETMLTVTQCPHTTKFYSLGAYYALDAIWHMIRTANTFERRIILEKLVQGGAVDICLNKAMNHPNCIHRQLGVNLLRCFSSESFLGEMITSQQTSEIMIAMCKFILRGPDFFVQQMGDSSLTWQSNLCFGNFSTSTTKAATYAPRFYAMAQESAAWCIQGLLLRSPPPNQRFCLEILKHDPELVDLLFECATSERHPWYPETQVDAIVCEAIALLFCISLEAVPGIPAHPDNDSQQEFKAEHDALIDSLKILTSRPNWAEKIIAVWKKIDNERWQLIKPMIAQVTTRYHAQTRLDHETFLTIFEYRGTSRITMLRLIATLSHFVDQCNISDADLLSFLPIGLAASQNIKSMQQSTRAEADTYTWIERSMEIFRSPIHTVFTLEKVYPPQQIADESIIGPTAYLRLLTVLASRGTLKAIQKWKRLPKESSFFTTLTEVKAASNRDAIQRTLVLALNRLTARRETGHKRIREEDEMDFAGFAYSSGAELAAALVAFDVASKGEWEAQIRGARKELVLCIGNAAEMALGLQRYRQALNYALGAVSAAKELPPHDVVEDTVKAKNGRRVDRARNGLSGQK